jgi:hypothetical protein
VEPLLAAAGAQRLQWFVDLDLGADLDAKNYDGVLAAIQKVGG